MAEPLLIVGASARAAAQSARRAGLVPSAVDCFGDVDLLAACARSVRLDGYPSGLIEAEFPAMDWIYTGALENQPEQIAALAAVRPLLGIAGESLRRVRDPGELFSSLSHAGFDCLPWRASAEELPRDGSWLSKPYRSAGGARISRWTGDAIDACGARYYQQFTTGLACGACYVGNADDAVLLGVTEQLVGQAWTGARDFQYCGSCGPLAVSRNITAKFRSLGRHLAHEFQLKGLFGVDVILAADYLRPLEVNPRYTASIEVLERANGIAALQIHLDACRHGLLPHEPVPRCFAGKAIIYAQRDFVVQELPPDECSMVGESWPWIADVPARGTSIRAGSPVLSLLASGSDRGSVLASLHERAAALTF